MRYVLCFFIHLRHAGTLGTDESKLNQITRRRPRDDMIGKGEGVGCVCFWDTGELGIYLKGWNNNNPLFFLYILHIS
ncbi:hypothetical protein F4811DRAFT_295261 [Daldinia bambusicola]|nr:hypothetical protein F4811DRAFT_295261 [Daldinia bambusicola]